MGKIEYNELESILKAFADDVSGLNNKIYTHEIPLNEYELNLYLLMTHYSGLIKELENDKNND